MSHQTAGVLGAATNNLPLHPVSVYRQPKQQLEPV